MAKVVSNKGSKTKSKVSVAKKKTPKKPSVRKPKYKKTMVVLLLDASGSMGSRQADVVGGVNTFIQEQKALKGKCDLLINQFSLGWPGDWGVNKNPTPSPIVKTITKSELKDANSITANDYIPYGSTPLIDAFCETIKGMGKIEKDTKVIFVVFTDGYENASRENTVETARELVKERKDWDFVFMGAGIDAWGQGSILVEGLSTYNSMSYDNSAAGTKMAYSSLSSSAARMRCAVAAGQSIEANAFFKEE